ncbi:hypothetical protein GCM10025857_23380 [Alicyclobacillus contaminans]|nr:hypothetical protein GCM10025857_23380 [Alicyclobacillus contaminans]
MRKWIALTIPLSSSLLCACGPALAAQPEPKTTTGETPQAIVFFQNVPKPNVPLTLQPDPRVEQALPQIVPPKQPVVVYLPVYPGAAKAAPDKRIGDMGTPLDGDLVDGTLYFQVKATPDQIEAWYAKQLRTLGYRESGHGQSTANGAVVSGTVSFTKDGVPPASPSPRRISMWDSSCPPSPGRPRSPSKRCTL